MKIPYTKAHGARNDFLLTWAADAPAEGLAEAAIAICDRHTGAGADGWLLVSQIEGADARIRLFNPDGGEVEMSGNGTRCAAAFLIHNGLEKSDVTIVTGAGPKRMRLLERNALCFQFEMNMGKPAYRAEELRYLLQLPDSAVDCTILNVGNPQCAVFVEDFHFDWRKMGAVIERHPHFPKRTNVSFVRTVDAHTIDVRFFERGAGETMSSGTGSTGAVASAVLRGLVKSPVEVRTPAGPLQFVWNSQQDDIFMAGPAQIVAKGEFYL